MILGAPRSTLPETLLSLRHAVDEIAVVYTADADPRVAGLARELGAVLHERALPAWGGDFAAARNGSLDLATADYALVVDDDERLVGVDALRSALRTRVPDALRVRVSNVMERGNVEDQFHVRVVRLDGRARFEGAIHETIEGPDIAVVAVGRPYLVHYGYSDPDVLQRKYGARNRPLADRHARDEGAHRRIAGVHLRSDDAHEDPGHRRVYFVDSWRYFEQPMYWRADYGYRGDWRVEELVLKLRAERVPPGASREAVVELLETTRNFVKEQIVTLVAVKPARPPQRELQSRFPVHLR
jgi:hypothetical protein